MTKEDEIKNEIASAAEPTPTPAADVAATPASASDTPASAPKPASFRGGDRKPRGRTGGRPTRRGSFERVKPEFDQKMIDIRRVTRVVAGGRRFSFAVAVIIGDRKGSVGVGTGKAGDTSLAIEKAFRDARKNLLRLKLTKNMSIPHEVRAKYSSGEIKLMPNKEKGLVVGSSARILLELAGVRDVTAKILSGSKNKLNIANATMKALGELMPPREKKVKEAEASEEKK
jgi:small subunit ribosomal protein S5